MKGRARRGPRYPGASRSRTAKFDHHEGNTVERGRNILVIGPDICDEWPTALKDKVAVRRATALRGACPACGARVELAGQPRPGAVTRVLVRHDDNCPAVADG
jgi:hypothetical protein